MNVIDNVRRAFRSKYSFDIQSTWLQACLAWLRDQFQLPDLTNNYSLEKIYNQWLHTDISMIADACSLPNDLDLNAKKVQLTGKYALQINSILCITEPYYSQVLDIHGDQNENERIDTDTTETQQWKPPPPKRVLYLELTDGRTILRGFEYEPINDLNRDTTLPGAKILVSGPVLFRRGMLLLTSKNTQVLGGYVEDLLDKSGSMETALLSLSKTASKSNEGRTRFDRLNIKVHRQIVSDNSIPDIRPNQTNSHQNEDEIDEFIRQAYADGMLHDDSHLAPEPVNYNPPVSSNHNIIPTSIDPPEELIVLSDDEGDHHHSTHMEIPPPPPAISYEQLSYHSSPIPRQPIEKISLPYTYLSLISSSTMSPHIAHQDYQIKGCFSSLATNPRLIKNEFDLQAYLNDGSDCILVRLASDLLAQRIGITVNELMAKRKACQNDLDKQKFQTDFNERLKNFGHGMGRVNSTMTIRFFSDNQLPMITEIDDN